MAFRRVLLNMVQPLCSRRSMTINPPIAHGIISPFIARLSNMHQPAPAVFNPVWSCSMGAHFSTSTGGLLINNLTDTRFPKRRPGTKPRRKRASLKPPGPYAWVQYTPGEPIPRSRPNEGSVQGRKHKKRVAQRKAFIMSETKKRKAQFVEFKKQRDIKRVERKMAQVAREKAWAERLVELQQLEAEKKAAMAS